MSGQGETLAAAMTAALIEMPSVEKNGTANYGKYVTLDHLITSTRPILAKHGLAITQQLSNIDGKPALTTKILHGPSDQAMESTMPLVLAKQDMQGFGAAATYARRYAWAALLGVCDDVDDDGHRASTPVAEKPRAAEPQNMEKFKAPTAAQSVGVGFKWKFGEHKDKTLAETPLDYVIQQKEKTTSDWLRGQLEAFLAENGELVTTATGDEDIPF